MNMTILRQALILTIAYSLYHLQTLPTNLHQLFHVNQTVLHALSGSLGSALSITIFYPLETVRTRLQVGLTTSSSSNSSTPHSSHHKWSFGHVYTIYHQEGLHGLYKGWYSLVMALMSLNFVYFYCFHSLRTWLPLYFPTVTTMNKEWMGNQMVLDLLVGYVSGCIGVLVTGPLWLVNTRLKLQGVALSNDNDDTRECCYAGMIHCLYTIYKEEGVWTLWKGTFTSIILSLNPAIQLAAYEMLKRHHFIVRSGSLVVWRIIDYARHYGGGGASELSHDHDDVTNTSDGSSIEHFVNALLSKFIATLITYPIQVIQTRQRWSKNDDTNNDSNQSNDSNGKIKKKKRRWIGASTVHDLMEIVHQQGFIGLYRGLESKLLQTCLNSALMFVIYEKLVEFLTKLLS